MNETVLYSDIFRQNYNFSHKILISSRGGGGVKLSRYLTTHPHSIVAVNLRACSHYQLYNGKAAECPEKKDFRGLFISK